MKRQYSLRRRLRSLETLSEAVGAMKSLSAHHLRSARAALPAAHAYRQGVDDALAVIGLHQRQSPGDASAILIIAADLGLCGGYNSQLAVAAIDDHGRLNARHVYCVGHRPLSLLKRAGVKVDREYSAPTSVSGLTELLLRLGEDLLFDYLEGTFGTLNVISARFEGVGEFTPACTRLLPIDPPESTSSMKPSTYVSADHLAAVAIREYLYIRLFQASLTLSHPNTERGWSRPNRLAAGYRKKHPPPAVNSPPSVAKRPPKKSSKSPPPRDDVNPSVIDESD